jgi:hypothetical protein
LVIPVAIVFSFWAPLGAAGGAWVFAVHSVPHGGSAAMLHLHETPVFMRVQRIPSFVTMRLAGTQSQWQMADFHSFLRLLSYFGPFLPIFIGSELFYTNISGLVRSPKLRL